MSIFGLIIVLYFIFLLIRTTLAEESSEKRDGLTACSRLRNLQEYEDSHYSQNGEDGLLLSLLDILGLENSSKYYVEFGVESGVQCNTRILREALGFVGLSMDGGYSNSNINLQKEFILESNIISLFKKYEVPSNLDVLSIDVDMFDFWILSRIFQHGGYRPRIIIVETNPSLCVTMYKAEYGRMNSIPLTVTHPSLTNQTVWDGTRYAGANPKAFQLLANAYGYDMVHCERCGVNCFLVRRDALPVECRTEFHSRLPFVPYPCFTTLSPTGEKLVGHRVDLMQRRSISLAKTDEDNVPLLERMVALGADFQGHMHVSEGVHGYACGSHYAGWGSDWWSTLSIWTPLLQKKASIGAAGMNFEVAKVDFARGTRLFASKAYDEAAEAFSRLIGDDNWRLGSLAATDIDAVLAKRKSDSSFGVCLSHHRSESSCAVAADTFRNLALTLVHAAIEAQGVTPVEEQLSLFSKARKALQASHTYVHNTGAEDEATHAMVGFLAFVTTHFPIDSRNLTNLHRRCAKINVHIVDSHSEKLQAVGPDGSLSNAGLAADIWELTVCACESLKTVADKFCMEQKVSNCENLYGQLLEAVHIQIFDGIPYDLMSAMQGGDSHMSQLLERAQPRKGWTALPAPFSKWKVFQGASDAVCERPF